MIVTQKEAAQTLCPFIRDWDYDRNAEENSPAIYEHVKCKAASCMAWRFVREFDQGFKPDLNSPGYCGMAYPVGRP